MKLKTSPTEERAYDIVMHVIEEKENLAAANLAVEGLKDAVSLRAEQTPEASAEAEAEAGPTAL